MAVDLSRVNKNSAMGATVRSDGTGFRTWAPNTKTVSVVAGSALAVINEPSWRPASEDHLAALGDGSWAAFWPKWVMTATPTCFSSRVPAAPDGSGILTRASSLCRPPFRTAKRFPRTIPPRIRLPQLPHPAIAECEVVHARWARRTYNSGLLCQWSIVRHTHEGRDRRAT